VLSRQPEYVAPGAVVCDDWTEALAIAREQAAEDGVDEICRDRRRRPLRTRLPRAARVYLTEVDGEAGGRTSSCRRSTRLAGAMLPAKPSPPAPTTSNRPLFRVLRARVTPRQSGRRSFIRGNGRARHREREVGAMDIELVTEGLRFPERPDRHERRLGDPGPRSRPVA